MNKTDLYIYPAVFTYESDQEISVEIPDLEVATSGADEVEALLSARELLGGILCELEESGEKIPKPTPVSKIKVQDNESVVLVDVYMPLVRNISKFIDRTVTLPTWLNNKVLEHNIDLSYVLQKALFEELGVQNPR